MKLKHIIDEVSVDVIRTAEIRKLLKEYDALDGVLLESNDTRDVKIVVRLDELGFFDSITNEIGVRGGPRGAGNDVRRPSKPKPQLGGRRSTSEKPDLSQIQGLVNTPGVMSRLLGAGKEGTKKLGSMLASALKGGQTKLVAKIKAVINKVRGKAPNAPIKDVPGMPPEIAKAVDTIAPEVSTDTTEPSDEAPTTDSSVTSEPSTDATPTGDEAPTDTPSIEEPSADASPEETSANDEPLVSPDTVSKLQRNAGITPAAPASVDTPKDEPSADTPTGEPTDDASNTPASAKVEPAADVAPETRDRLQALAGIEPTEPPSAATPVTPPPPASTTPTTPSSTPVSSPVPDSGEETPTQSAAPNTSTGGSETPATSEPTSATSTTPSSTSPSDNQSQRRRTTPRQGTPTNRGRAASPAPSGPSSAPEPSDATPKFGSAEWSAQRKQQLAGMSPEEREAERAKAMKRVGFFKDREGGSRGVKDRFGAAWRGFTAPAGADLGKAGTKSSSYKSAFYEIAKRLNEMHVLHRPFALHEWSKIFESAGYPPLQEYTQYIFEQTQDEEKYTLLELYRMVEEVTNEGTAVATSAPDPDDSNKYEYLDDENDSHGRGKSGGKPVNNSGATWKRMEDKLNRYRKGKPLGENRPRIHGDVRTQHPEEERAQKDMEEYGRRLRAAAARREAELMKFSTPLYTEPNKKITIDEFINIMAESDYDIHESEGLKQYIKKAALDAVTTAAHGGTHLGIDGSDVVDGGARTSTDDDRQYIIKKLQKRLKGIQTAADKLK
jgi:hypothetical protein